MGSECTSQEPLLLSTKPEDDGFSYAKKTPFLIKSTKWFLKFLMWVVFIAWVSFVFSLPSESVQEWVETTSGTVFGVTGSVLLFGGPLFIILFLGIIYLRISGEQEFQEKRKPKDASFRLRTFPVIVDGPFGVVTAAELIGILVVFVFIIWALSVYAIQNYSLIPFYKSQGKRNVMLKHTGLRFGSTGLYCLAFLFLPVARGSVLLQLIDIPFEQATRYHVWLGHLTMSLFTLHGLCYMISWLLEGGFFRHLITWKNEDIANLPGVISLSAGLLMWMTSLPPVRRLNFELFFYTHQLYVVFVVFLVMHVGDAIFSTVAAGIFLFMLDRFLRFFQSRKTVDILSARRLQSGTVELVISKPKNLRYNALSWVFLQVRELSWLQWHPFSVSSSPLDGERHISILVKVLGNWTQKLRGRILSDSEEQDELDGPVQTNLKLTASVEGPYGHNSPYHLTYENLVLVAGGIGISPFLAILSDILHRLRDSKPCLPRNIFIIWATKNSHELPLLHSLDMDAICPFFNNMLNLEIQTYVTQESHPPLEEGKSEKHESFCNFRSSSPSGMSGLVGTGNTMWSGTYVMVPIIGFVASVALLNVFYVYPFDVSYHWHKGLLLLACMVGSVIVFGGFVIGLWHLWDSRTLPEERCEYEYKTGGVPRDRCKNSSHESGINAITTYSQRPDVKEIFGKIGEHWGNVDIGVIVSGPRSLRTSVAEECRSRNLGRRGRNAVFHFHSHSFDL